jgi:uroporphyrinogen decarboxylase
MLNPDMNVNTDPGMTSQQRVNRAIRFLRPDRTPRDFAAVPEIWNKLQAHFGVSDRFSVLRRLGVDCRIVSYDSFCRHPEIDPENVDGDLSLEKSSTGSMWRRQQPDGSNSDIWGVSRLQIEDDFGRHEHFASHPLAHAEQLDDLKQYLWPKSDWWDFSSLRETIESFHDETRYNIRYRLGSVFETAWSMIGFEKFQIDLAMKPQLPCYVMERVAEVHLENLRIVLETAADLIDIVYYYDDLATGDRLLISQQMYADYIQPFHQKIIDLASRYDKPIMTHCCGSIYPMIPRFIDMGISVLNPIQPLAKNMEAQRLADEFGGKIAFHGGIDIQELLPRATPEEVSENVAKICNVLGENGGYILSGSHHLQADTPLENILAMYGLSIE